MCKKVKLYISGAITDNPDYKSQFNQAEKILKKKGFRVVNPIKGEPLGKSWGFYMRRDIRKLTKCQGLVLLKGWEKSRGAKFERDIAVGLNFMIFELSDDSKLIFKG